MRGLRRPLNTQQSISCNAASKPSGMTPTLSIVIPTKNAGPAFQETVSAIFLQEEIPSLEVIVIDSGSTDGTLAICRRFPLKLVEITSEEFSHGGTRNMAASLASGEFLVFLVQDALPVGPHWLRDLLAPLQANERIAGAYGRHLARPGASRRQAREIERYFAGPERLQSSPADHTFSNVSSIIRKKVFDAIPFPPAQFGEDQLWAREALAAGYLIQYQPSSVVVHSHDDDAATAYRRGQQEGALARALHPEARPSSPLVILLEAITQTAQWALRGETTSCRYSVSMAAWHFGYRRGYWSRDGE